MEKIKENNIQDVQWESRSVLVVFQTQMQELSSSGNIRIISHVFLKGLSFKVIYQTTFTWTH